MSTYPPGRLAHVERLLASYRRLLGRPLIAVAGGTPEQAAALEAAPFVVVSHGTEDDPLLNYGNRMARTLWALDWEALLRTPSRLTAEAPARGERAGLLARVARDGYVDDYQGVRISATGRRFRIERATVWNIIDADGHYRGQAATFRHWQWLDTADG